MNIFKNILGRRKTEESKEPQKPSWMVMAIDSAYQHTDKHMPPWYIKTKRVERRVSETVNYQLTYIVTNGEIEHIHGSYLHAHCECERLLRAHEAAMPWSDNENLN